MIKEVLKKLVVNKEDLTYDEAACAMKEIMSGEANDSLIASFLTALHIKGETVDEISACAEVMRSYALSVPHNGDVMEIVGTGGDGAQSINISTISSFVTAAAGGKVAKHGNRAASSKCGAADCLEAMGVKLAVEPEVSTKLLDDVGMTFLFAQKYHSAMKYVAPVRKAIGIPTIFNILGPLANPARAELQLLGVYDKSLIKPMAQALSKLGVKRGMVVYGTDGLDEVSVGAPTKVCEFNGDKFEEYEITPEHFGFEPYSKDELRGGDPKENADAAIRILNGEKGAGRNAVLLNAGCAIHILKGVSIPDGIKIAAEMIDSKKALRVAEELIERTNAA